MSQEGDGQPSQEELQAYLTQLRDADPVEIVAQAYTMLGTGAEVKLGRPDARMLIDAMNGLVRGANKGLPEELTERMMEGVGQLQMAQVQAESAGGAEPGADSEVGSGAPSGQGPGAAGQPRPAAPAGAPAAGVPNTGAGKPRLSSPGDNKQMTDRLWIPGRDPKPPSK